MHLRRLLKFLTLPIAALVTMIVMAGSAGAQPHSPTESQNLARIQAGFDAWRDGTGSVFDSLADDATWAVLGNTVVSGVYTKPDLQTQVLAPFNARLVDGRLTPTVRALYADGDTVIAYFEADGVALDGLPYHNVYTWILQMQDDEITRVDALLDSIAFNDLWHRVQPVSPQS